ncbi:MAG: AraC family transcriptional regulator [Clostridiaceae bacterium]|nr:AraC family transcriptional regulator [Clostridiaceae bacterium]
MKNCTEKNNTKKNIKIFDMGTNQVHNSETFFVNRPKGLKQWLLLIVKSWACFTINGHEAIVQPDTAIFFKPHSPQIYHGIQDKGNYCDHWMEFAIEEELIEHMGIPVSTPITGFDIPKIDTMFKLLQDEHYFGNIRKDFYIQLYTQIIFEKISDAVSFVPKKNHDFYELHRELRIHPERDWNVDSAAAELNFSKSHFQSKYRELFGVSFGMDVIKSRILRAGTLLDDTNMTVSQIGIACGYHSDDYFTRQFKQITGLTPSQYRRRNKTIT